MNQRSKETPKNNQNQYSDSIVLQDKDFNKNNVKEKDSVFDLDFKLCDFRMNAEKFKGCRETLINFRKSLTDKWDYNAFVGILMSVKASKHGDAGCTNMAIGQGDNFKSTEMKLIEKGLLDVFHKYKGKNYDKTVTVGMVEHEILSIAPEYRQICDFFNTMVILPMSEGNYEFLPPLSALMEEKKIPVGTSIDYDLTTKK